jgi:hypothetical protein
MRFNNKVYNIQLFTNIYEYYIHEEIDHKQYHF